MSCQSFQFKPTYLDVLHSFPSQSLQPIASYADWTKQVSLATSFYFIITSKLNIKNLCSQFHKPSSAFPMFADHNLIFSNKLFQIEDLSLDDNY